MTRFTLHVPNVLNDGSPTPREELTIIEGQILALAGGFTVTAGVGAWTSPDTGSIYNEPVRLYHVDTDDDIEPELGLIAQRTAQRLAQEAVYLTAQDIRARLFLRVRNESRVA